MYCVGASSVWIKHLYTGRSPEQSPKDHTSNSMIIIKCGTNTFTFIRIEKGELIKHSSIYCTECNAGNIYHLGHTPEKSITNKHLTCLMTTDKYPICLMPINNSAQWWQWDAWCINKRIRPSGHKVSYYKPVEKPVIIKYITIFI